MTQFKTIGDYEKEYDEQPLENKLEQEYRRGYYDGFIQACKTFDESPFGKAKTYIALFEFWKTGLLAKWRSVGLSKERISRIEYPPSPVLQRERKSNVSKSD